MLIVTYVSSQKLTPVMRSVSQSSVWSVEICLRDFVAYLPFSFFLVRLPLSMARNTYHEDECVMYINEAPVLVDDTSCQTDFRARQMLPFVFPRYLEFQRWRCCENEYC